MNKIFSHVTLETETGIVAAAFMSSIPTKEEILESVLYLELIEDCDENTLIEVRVLSYSYGDYRQKPIPASKTDLAIISMQDEVFFENDKVVLLECNNFAIGTPVYY